VFISSRLTAKVTGCKSPRGGSEVSGIAMLSGLISRRMIKLLTVNKQQFLEVFKK